MPNGWIIASMNTITEMVYGKGLLTKELAEEGYPVYGANGVIGKYPKYLYEDEKVIISCRGAASGVIHKTAPKSFITSNSIVFNLKTNEINLDYFKYALLSVDRSKIVTGTAQPQITIENLKDFEVPIAPFPEQQRIVAKLDELMEKIDRSRARLERIPKILKRFRQSILSAAVSGKLTEEWRERNAVREDTESFLLNIKKQRIQDFNDALELYKLKKGKKPKESDVDFSPEYRIDDTYPESWRVTRIKDVSDCLDSIREPINKDERSKRLGSIPYYGANGPVGWIDDYLFDEDLVVVVEDETFIGRTIPFSYIIRGKTWVNNHAHVLRPLGGMSVEYFNACLAYYNFTPLTSGTTGRRKLTQGALMEAELAIAPIEEQNEIVRRIEQLFALADKIEARYSKAKAQIDKLPQSLLAKAFRGDLVPQYENDEPASVLLERIQSSKAKKVKA